MTMVWREWYQDCVTNPQGKPRDYNLIGVMVDSQRYLGGATLLMDAGPDGWTIAGWGNAAGSVISFSGVDAWYTSNRQHVFSHNGTNPVFECAPFTFETVAAYNAGQDVYPLRASWGWNNSEYTTKQDPELLVGVVTPPAWSQLAKPADTGTLYAWNLMDRATNPQLPSADFYADLLAVGSTGYTEYSINPQCFLLPDGSYPTPWRPADLATSPCFHVRYDLQQNPQGCDFGAGVANSVGIGWTAVRGAGTFATVQLATSFVVSNGYSPAAAQILRSSDGRRRYRDS